MKVKKALVLLVAVALVVGGAVGGTLAWLTAQTGEVKNTFTTSDVDIGLTETTGGEAKEFKMVPGCTIAKDPKVTVKGGSEKCWLFVKVEKSANFDTFMEYVISNGWQALTDVAGVYYREVEASADDQPFGILEGDEVTVKDTVTKKQMNDLTAETYPTLTFTAYACQFAKGEESFTAADAWAQLNPPTT